MSEPAPAGVATGGRGGPQIIPRPPRWRPGRPAPWLLPDRIVVADVERALTERGDPPPPDPDGLPTIALPGPARRPAAVLCAVFDEDDQAHVVLTRRSSRLRSHTHQVSFPGGRLDPGEDEVGAALREAHEEVGIRPDSVRVIGRLSALHTVLNPAPITPFVGVLPGRPLMTPNPAEVERAFTAPLVEMYRPEVYREELWTFADGSERSIQFFELVGDTVWGATARMLSELLCLLSPPAR